MARQKGSKLTEIHKQRISEAVKNENNGMWKGNEGICKCGHHSKDHSYSLAPKCCDLECDKCNCQNYEFEHFPTKRRKTTRRRIKR